MNLDEHSAGALFCFDSFVDAVHGDFDQVGGGALHYAVDGHALAGVSNGEDAAGDFGDGAAAAEDGFDVALGLGFHHALI